MIAQVLDEFFDEYDNKKIYPINQNVSMRRWRRNKCNVQKSSPNISLF